MVPGWFFLVFHGFSWFEGGIGPSDDNDDDVESDDGDDSDDDYERSSVCGALQSVSCLWTMSDNYRPPTYYYCRWCDDADHIGDYGNDEDNDEDSKFDEDE